MWMSAHPLTSPVEKDTFVSMPQAIIAVSAKLDILLMSSVGHVLVSCTYQPKYMQPWHLKNDPVTALCIPSVIRM